MFVSPHAFLLSLGIVLLFYALMAFDGEVAGGKFGASLAGILGVVVLFGLCRWLWTESVLRKILDEVNT